MALDFQTALSQYGYVAQLAGSNPDIQNVLNQAVAGEWDSARFERELMNTGWYKSLSETRRAAVVQQATDPATWSQTLGNKAAEVERLVKVLGKDPATFYAGAFQAIASRALTEGWSDAQLQEFIATTQGGWRISNGVLTGQAGDYESHIRQTWAEYGLAISQETARGWASEVAAGRQTLGGLDNEVRAIAKKTYSAFADQIDSGMTMWQIADPYMQTMANTLELSAGAIKLTDPYVKKALQGKDGQPMAMWEFERSLKDDARWQFTKQAKDETYAVLQQVGNDWGFL